MRIYVQFYASTTVKADGTLIKRGHSSRMLLMMCSFLLRALVLHGLVIRRPRGPRWFFLVADRSEVRLVCGLARRTPDSSGLA